MGHPAFENTAKETAGPSTPLRSGRDDNFVVEPTLVIPMNCHPDRSEAEWRDLRFLSLSHNLFRRLWECAVPVRVLRD
jgi:hypothetical protein